MRWHSPFRRIVLLAALVLGASCATTQVVTQNIQRVTRGQSMDTSGLNQAVTSDTHRLETNLEQLRQRFAKAVAQLRANVEKRWGRRNTRVASRTVYVKYTQGYKSRVITDFDRGSITVETVDQTDPRGSLRAAIVGALLTPNDPAAVDVFSDKEIALDPARRPYLYGLVRDNERRPIQTRRQAELFADYLVAHRLQTRVIESEDGHQTAWFVSLMMVRNYEAVGERRYRALVIKYSAEYGVSPSLVLAIMRTESNFNPFAVSGAPAYGLMQLVPTSGGRAALKRVSGVDETPTPDYLFDPDHNIELGAAYLGELSNNDFHAIANPSSRDYCVIAAYNTGPTNVTRTFDSDRERALGDINDLTPGALYERLHTDLPFEETREYVARVTLYRKQFVDVTAQPATAVPAVMASPSITADH